MAIAVAPAGLRTHADAAIAVDRRSAEDDDPAAEETAEALAGKLGRRGSSRSTAARPT